MISNDAIETKVPIDQINTVFFSTDKGSITLPLLARLVEYNILVRKRKVMMVMYDLPTGSAKERRQLALFRKKLLWNGYLQFQKSNYVKLLRNGRSISTEKQKIKKEAPEKGNICMLSMDVETFRSIDWVSEKMFNIAVFSEDLVVI